MLHYGEVDDPPPLHANDVLIRVRASSLDRVDVYFREGSHGMEIREGPYIGGRDIAGDVVAIGADVRTVGVGDAVVASGVRAHAELAVAPATLTLLLPRTAPTNKPPRFPPPVAARIRRLSNGCTSRKARRCS